MEEHGAKAFRGRGGERERGAKEGRGGDKEGGKRGKSVERGERRRREGRGIIAEGPLRVALAKKS